MAELLDIISQEQVDRLYALFDAMDKVDSKLSGLNKSVTSAAEKTKGLNDIQKEAEKLAKDQASAMSSLEKQRQKAYEQAAKQEAKEREIAAALTMEVKSIKDAETQNKALLEVKKKLNLTTEEGRKKNLEYNKALDKNTEFIRANSDAATKQRMRIGDYANSIKEALSALGPFGRAINDAAGSAGVFLTAIVRGAAGMRAASISTGIMTKAINILKIALISSGIGALVVLLGSLYTYFTRTGEGADKLAIFMAKVRAVVDVLIDRFAKFGEGIVLIFTGEFKAGAEKISQTFKGIGEEMRTEIKLAGELKEESIKRGDIERENNILIAKNNLAKEKALEIANSENSTLKEKEAAIKQAMALTQQNYSLITKSAEAEIKSLRDTANMRTLNSDELDRLAELEIEQINRKSAAQGEINSLLKLQNKIMGEAEEIATNQLIKQDQALQEYIHTLSKADEIIDETFDIPDPKESIDPWLESLKNMQDFAKKAGEATTEGLTKQIEELNKFHELGLINEADYQAALAKLEEQRLKGRLEKISENVAQIQAIGQTLLDFNQFLIDSETQKMEQAKAYELSLAGDNAEKREEIEKKYDKEATKLKIKQAKQDKAQALFGAIIKTAQAILAGLAYGPPLGYIFAALNAVLGGIQIGVIASQPIPQFAKGTRKAPRGLAVVGERGRELIMGADGSVSLSPSTATLVNLGRGGQRIIPNRETEMLIRAAKGADDERSLKVLNEIRDGNNKIVEAIKNKPVFVINKNPGRIDSRPGFENYLKNKLG